VTQTQNQVIELQYNVSPRVTVSGTRDQNGGFGFDTRIKKTW
jgi:translocation and assembly module TamB